MKWEPQPKGPCARTDCTKVATQAEYCMNHYHLFRRNGVPYRQDEISEQQAKNTYEQHWDEVIAANPPQIKYVRRGMVWFAASVNDPHAEHERAPRSPQQERKTEQQRLRRQRQREEAA
jgi:hypothetical protein